MMVFGHQKCSREYQVLIGSPEGVSGTPGNPTAHMGLVKEHTSPQGDDATYKAIGGGEGKWVRARKVWIRIPTSFSLPPSFLPPPTNMAGGRGQGQEPK